MESQILNERSHRIIYTDRCYTASELQQAGNFLTTQFNGKELSEIRRELLIAFDQERHTRMSYDQAIAAVDVTAKLLSEALVEE